ncbi:MAG: cytochrome P450 [Alphaproteobacteria bacterium]|nr:cytochrome P450 [Alphaproteobacteria bacterium]
MTVETAPAIPAHVPADRVIDFDIMNDPALRYDVFKRIKEIRDGAPTVCYTPRNGGHWMVFGREEIQRVLSEAPTFSSKALGGRRDADGEPIQTGPVFIPLSLDPPEHAPWRHLLLKYFGPAQVRGLEPFVRDWAERLIGKLDGRTSCDFLKDVAEPMPISVFMEQMGLPLERFDEFRALVMAALTPPAEGEDPTASMANHMRIMGVLADLIEARKLNPMDDLVSKLLADNIQGRPIAHEEMMSLCFLLFLAGLDTVTNAMAYGMRHLAADAELQEQLRNDRSKIPDAVEKFLRLYTFVNTSRLVTKDVELGGVKIRAGEFVWCMLWGGSNDPHSETEGGRHMAFGGGNHLCLGMHLARLELRIMYETWFDHIGAFSLAPDNKPAMRGGSVMNITRLLLNMEPRKIAA